MPYLARPPLLNTTIYNKRYNRLKINNLYNNLIIIILYH